MAGAPAPSLAEALEFDGATLDANRAGRLSSSQRERLAAWGRAALWRALLIFLALVALASACIFWGIRQGAPPLAWLGMLIALGNAYFTGLAGRYQMRLRQDIQRPESVTTISGEIARVIQPIGRIRLRGLRVAGRHLPLSKRAFAAFQHGRRYRLYLTRTTGYLLAAELLEAADSSLASKRNNSPPRATTSPSETNHSSTRPAAGASSRSSIFIASINSKGAPAATVSPAAAMIRTT